MGNKARILVVEDEKDVRDLLVLHLKREGYDPSATESAEEAMKIQSAGKFDLAVLDWMLPGMPGLELCKKWNQDMPVLMVTARADPSDIVLGLEMGASDFITKPFEMPVFLARVRATLRKNPPKSLDQIRIGALLIEVAKCQVSCADQAVQLTASEFKLLVVLAQKRGKVLSRNQLIEYVRGEDITVTDRTIDTHVFGLRKKLGACSEFVETIRGIGYRIKTD